MSVKPLPKWAMINYAKLWQKFSSDEFDYSKCTKVLDDNPSITINQLKKNGWIKVSLDQNDSRKRIYKLIDPKKAVEDMTKG